MHLGWIILFAILAFYALAGIGVALLHFTRDDQGKPLGWKRRLLRIAGLLAWFFPW